MRLKDKIVSITGAGSGIGKSTAALFASKGATVVIADVQEDSGKAAVAEIEASGGNALFIPCDVTDAGSTTAMADQAVNAFGRIDVRRVLSLICPLASPKSESQSELLTVLLRVQFYL